MAVNLKVKATICENNTNLNLQFDTKKETYDIKINNTSLIATFDDTLIDNETWSDDLAETLRLLTLHRSVKLEKCYAIMKPINQIDINDKNENYLLFDINRKNIMPYTDLLKLNKEIRKQYDIITPKDETLFDVYHFLTNILDGYKENVTDLTAILEITTPVSKMEISITLNKDADTFKLNTRQSILRNDIWYNNLYCISLDYFKQENMDIKEINFPFIVEAHLNKDIENWSMFEVPLYICLLKNIYPNTENLPYIQAFLSMSDIPDEYKLLYTQKIPHETYIAEFSPKIYNIDFTQTFRLIHSTLRELGKASTTQEVSE